MHLNERFNNILKSNNYIAYNNKLYPRCYYCKKCKHIHYFKSDAFEKYNYSNYRKHWCYRFFYRKMDVKIYAGE